MMILIAFGVIFVLTVLTLILGYVGKVEERRVEQGRMPDDKGPPSDSEREVHA